MAGLFLFPRYVTFFTQNRNGPLDSEHAFLWAGQLTTHAPLVPDVISLCEIRTAWLQRARQRIARVRPRQPTVGTDADRIVCEAGSMKRFVRPSVCPVDRQQQRGAAGLLLSAVRAGDIDRQRRRRRPAAKAPQHGVQQQMRAVSC